MLQDIKKSFGYAHWEAKIHWISPDSLWNSMTLIMLISIFHSELIWKEKRKSFFKGNFFKFNFSMSSDTPNTRPNSCKTNQKPTVSKSTDTLFSTHLVTGHIGHTRHIGRLSTFFTNYTKVMQNNAKVSSSKQPEEAFSSSNQPTLKYHILLKATWKYSFLLKANLKIWISPKILFSPQTNNMVFSLNQPESAVSNPKIWISPQSYLKIQVLLKSN